MEKAMPVSTVLLLDDKFPCDISNAGLCDMKEITFDQASYAKRIIQHVQAAEKQYKNKIIVYSRNPKILELRSGNDVVIMPSDPKTARWNLFSEIQTDQDMTAFAKSLMPELTDDRNCNSRFWLYSAREMLIGTLTAFRNRHAVTGEPLSMKNLSDFWKDIYSCENISAALKKLGKFLHDNVSTKMYANCIGDENSNVPPCVFAIFKDYFDALVLPETTVDGNFSVRAWLRDPDICEKTLLLVNPASEKERFSGYFTCLLNLIVGEMQSIPGPGYSYSDVFFYKDLSKLFR